MLILIVGGLVDKAREIMEQLRAADVRIDTVHHSAFIDVLGRFGHLEEAEQYTMKHAADSQTALRALLGACRIHKDVERAERVYNRLLASPEFKANPDAPTLALMANIYTDAGRAAPV